MSEKNIYCIINGKKENLVKIQKLLDSDTRKSREIMRIMVLEYKLNMGDAAFFEKYVIEKGIPENFDEVNEQNNLEIARRPSCMISCGPHCPRCHSTNVEKYVRGGRGSSIVYRCKQCGARI